jgi:MYXO-CTERM domain-containing protein
MEGLRVLAPLVGLLALVGDARAGGPDLPADWTIPAPDGEDPHERPPGWDDYAAPEPPPFAIAPEYPLAAAFVPANANNFTPDGIESFDYVVVHTMQGSYAGTIAWFQNPNSSVSTQYVMRSSDGEVTQMVLDKDRAYHVGSMNRYSLGIEHEGFVDDPGKWYTWATYTASARLTRWLTHQHAIPVDRDHVVGHVELPNQTHTDPGPGWNWDLYMALIRETLLPGELHAVVVDRSKACKLVAPGDTWLKRAAMPTDTLAAADRCPVPAGSELTYFHARTDIDGHHYLYMPGGEGPCAGVGGLDLEAYVPAGEVTALCVPEAMAAVGATVRLDGGAPVAVGPDGGVVFPAGPGAHTLDVAADGLYEPASDGIDLDVHPGGRLVIALDPVPAPDPTGGDTSGDPGTTGDPGTDGSDAAGDVGSDAGDVAGDGTGGGQGGEASDAAGDATGAPPTSDGGGEVGGISSLPALPDGYGQDDDAGCSCRSAPPTPLLMGLFALGLRRRRRA